MSYIALNRGGLYRGTLRYFFVPLSVPKTTILFQNFSIFRPSLYFRTSKATFNPKMRCEIYQLFRSLVYLFYRSPMYETFWTEIKINKQVSENLEKILIKFRRSVNVALVGSRYKTFMHEMWLKSAKRSGSERPSLNKIGLSLLKQNLLKR